LEYNISVSIDNILITFISLSLLLVVFILMIV